ncbi:adenylate/guanylate cyclase domain-containing protein [Rivibacter subsaxonicus]|uniref:TolB-like protein n=1 Tax=Rivibacter subsaxonicus TaxID=457575 RepID=A0A4Q7VZW8_9BURK|nr:adenylate/guanylate cyclase domain-containing protein [Rivibacter subsaxonicus]RZU02128.1 TolB-like protein [Rivibacter subsaxonicus]
MENSELRHRLLAILAADGVGFSRLMAADERATVAMLDTARAMFSEQISAHGGRLVDTAGDSVLAVFDTAAGAVVAALAVQARLDEQRSEIPPEQCLRFRIGVHLGDVFEKADGTVYGDGVNIAARLQALADADGLAVSQSVQMAVQGHVAAHFENMGAQSVKNISRPVQVFRVRAGNTAAPRRLKSRRVLVAIAAALVVVAVAGVAWQAVVSRTPSSGVAASNFDAATARKTLAVLPFANLGDDKANELLTDGVTDELIGLLSRVRGLRVTGRDSSFYFKGKQVPMAEMARQLGVSYLVGGSVRRDGSRVRISAQLLNAADGAVLWSRSFDREFKDVLVAQGEIALGIAGSLTQSIDDSASFGGRGTTSPEAWQAFLEAKGLPAGQRVAAYERVLALDPNFARAHVALADQVLGLALIGKLSKQVASERMTNYLQEALRIDPRYDHAYGLLGAAAKIADDMQALRRHAQRALDIDPDSSAGHGWTAELKLHAGDMGGALPAFRRAAEPVPLVGWARLNYAMALRHANQPAQALQEAELALALDPNSVRALAEKAHCLLMLGRRDEALRLARERDFTTFLIRYGAPEDQAAMRQRKNLDAHATAWQEFLLGRPDAVVEHLEVDHSGDIQGRARVLFDAEYDPVRRRPSFEAWLARHKLTEAHERAQAWRAANPVPKR